MHGTRGGTFETPVSPPPPKEDLNGFLINRLVCLAKSHNGSWFGPYFFSLYVMPKEAKNS